MFDLSHPEDRMIRLGLIGLSSLLVAGFVGTAAIVALFVSLNFNVMSWLE